MARNRPLVKGFTLLATVTLALLDASAQGRGSTPARTPDGKPDLAGIYSFSTVTPLQRPDALAGKATLTDEEAAAFEASENTRLNRDLFDPEKGQPSAGYLPRSQGGVLSYNEFWYERGHKLTRDRRTSLIVDPPDGDPPRMSRDAESPTCGSVRTPALATRIQTGLLPTGACRVQLRPIHDPA